MLISISLLPGGAIADAPTVALAPGEVVAFVGHGAGHGVGMSQWGARGRALAGQTTAEILAAYYPGAVLTPGFDDRRPIRVLMAAGAVRTLPLGAYLASVVSSELPPGFPTATVEAQAIASRTYALWSLRPGQPYDVTSTVRSQAYGAPARSDALAAVAATDGITLTYGGQVIAAYFHDCSPFRTENVEDVWPGPALPYLRGIDDRDADGQPYAGDCPRMTWQAGPFTTEQVSAILARDARTNVGLLQAITYGPLSPAGNWKSLTLHGSRGTKTVALSVFRLVMNDGAASGRILFSADFQIVPPVTPAPAGFSAVL